MPNLSTFVLFKNARVQWYCTIKKKKGKTEFVVLVYEGVSPLLGSKQDYLCGRHSSHVSQRLFHFWADFAGSPPQYTRFLYESKHAN